MLKHTERVRRLLNEGNRQTAIAKHNAHVREEFRRAKLGGTIDLTDLMAAREQFEAEG